jgi:hypothetical protein
MEYKKPDIAAGLSERYQRIEDFNLKVDDKILVGSYFTSLVHRYPGIVGYLGDIMLVAAHDIHGWAVPRRKAFLRHPVKPTGGMAVIGTLFIKIIKGYRHILAGCPGSFH